MNGDARAIATAEADIRRLDRAIATQKAKVDLRDRALAEARRVEREAQIQLELVGESSTDALASAERYRIEADNALSNLNGLLATARTELGTLAASSTRRIGSRPRSQSIAWSARCATSRRRSPASR